MSQEDQPLNEGFYQNPLEYMQNYVRNLNNQIFLSEYHINNLYALLLIGRTSPWDAVKGNNPKLKEDVDVIVNQKVHNVKEILESLSNAYEDKSKKTAISQIQKLMGILKSKKKSIYIEKDRNSLSFKKFQTLAKMAKELEQKERPNKQREPELQDNPRQEGRIEQPQIQHLAETQLNQAKREQNSVQNAYNAPKRQLLKEKEQQPLQQIKQELKVQAEQNYQKPNESTQRQICQHKVESKQDCSSAQQVQKKFITHKKDIQYGGKEVFTIFYGLSNMSNLTALALTNILEYNATDRFIKFKISETYNMTIKSEDPFHFDTKSQFKEVPPELFTNHLFPYLTAAELFKCRAVCKQWLDHVKQSWHSTFKRQMFVQLLACQFCKDIEFYYKIIQLRNPFFQKISLLIHALIQIISWELITNYINANTLNLQLKRVLVLLFRLMGEQLPFTNLSSITDAFFDEHKHKFTNIKEKVSQFFSTLSGSDLSINQLRLIKTLFLDDHFMRVQEVNANDDKTPLLLNLLVKQITLQQILRNHIYLAQEYLLNTKKRLDNISSKMVYQKGYLEGVYKILLLKSTDSFTNQSQPNQLPNFNEMLQSIFNNQNCQKPDFVLKNKRSSTEIYLDRATKLDIILSTVCNLNDRPQANNEHQVQQQNEKTQMKNQNDQKQEDIVFINQYENEQARIETLNQIKKSKNQIVNEISLQISSKQTQTQAHQEQTAKK